jgi:hypothetical protein
MQVPGQLQYLLPSSNTTGNKSCYLKSKIWSKNFTTKVTLVQTHIIVGQLIRRVLSKFPHPKHFLLKDTGPQEYHFTSRLFFFFSNKFKHLVWYVLYHVIKLGFICMLNSTVSRSSGILKCCAMPRNVLR